MHTAFKSEICCKLIDLNCSNYRPEKIAKNITVAKNWTGLENRD